MVIVSITAYIRPSNRRELLSTCRSIDEKTCQEKNCTKAHVMQHVDDESHLCVEQRWADRIDMEDYFRSDIFGALIGAMQVLAKSWEIQINESDRTEGMDTLEAIRSKKMLK